MPNAQRTITINRPVGEVFTFFATPANDPKWQPRHQLILAVALFPPSRWGGTVGFAGC